MEVTTLSLQIFINVFVLLLNQHVLSYTVLIPGFPIISPNRLQFFELESVFINCTVDKDLNEWRVKRKLYKMSPADSSKDCSIPAPSCTIDLTFETHSGEYWCENDEGIRSFSLKIAVTGGPVILNISAKPVKEGSDVTLHCINKNTAKTHFSDFYKDDIHLTTYYETNTLILSNITKSDEGLYKCKISREGESPESWLAVVKPMEEKGSDEKTQPLTNLKLLITISLVVCTVIPLLILIIGLILCKKYKDQNVADKQDDVTYAAIEIKKTGSKAFTTAFEQHSSEQDSTYSVIALRRDK